MDKLPYGGFRDLTRDECDRLTLGYQTYPADGDKAVWLEVDLQYDVRLHESHNEFPCAPESRQVSD